MWNNNLQTHVKIITSKISYPGKSNVRVDVESLRTERGIPAEIYEVGSSSRPPWGFEGGSCEEWGHG